jgi:hypothetical protein
MNAPVIALRLQRDARALFMNKPHAPPVSLPGRDAGCESVYEDRQANIFFKH